MNLRMNHSAKRKLFWCVTFLSCVVFLLATSPPKPTEQDRRVHILDDDSAKPQVVNVEEDPAKSQEEQGAVKVQVQVQEGQAKPGAEQAQDETVKVEKIQVQEGPAKPEEEPAHDETVKAQNIEVQEGPAKPEEEPAQDQPAKTQEQQAEPAKPQEEPAQDQPAKPQEEPAQDEAGKPKEESAKAKEESGQDEPAKPVLSKQEPGGQLNEANAALDDNDKSRSARVRADFANSEDKKFNNN